MESYFGYFEHPMIVFNAYLHAKNKLQYSLFSYNITFWIILQFDWPGAFWPITWDPKLCQICLWNINDNISFPYRLFPRKTNLTKFFQKFPKTLFRAHPGPFCPIWGQKWIFLEKRALSVFQYSNYLPLCQKSEKPNEPFLRKLLEGHTRNQFISLISFWDVYSQF